MIQIEEAKQNARRIYDDEYEIMAYDELTDSWCFGFMDKNGHPVYGASVRVNKQTGAAMKWDLLKNKEEFQSKVIGKTVFL